MHTRKMITEIETEEDYREALNRFLQICNIPKNEKEEQEFFRLSKLMEEYEEKNCRYD
ncbi:hypothetical protein [Maribellus mangrovi]|uniref:hypothetical protein n=1 Tax=Maribellus mangrovi TaxID=3133146 RepID=UPI0030EF565A